MVSPKQTATLVAACLCALVAASAALPIGNVQRLRRGRRYRRNEQQSRSLWGDDYWNDDEPGEENSPDDGGHSEESKQKSHGHTARSHENKSTNPKSYSPQSSSKVPRHHESPSSSSSSGKGKGKGTKSSKTSKESSPSDPSTRSPSAATSAPTSSSAPSSETDDEINIDDLPPIGSNITIVAFQPASMTVIPPTPTGSEFDVNTMYLFSNYTRNVGDVREFRLQAIVGQDENNTLSIWTRVDGYCQRLSPGVPVIVTDSSALCHFTYTVADPDTEMMIGSFVASGLLRLRDNGAIIGDGDQSAILSVEGGTDLFEGVAGQVFINPASLNRDVDPPEIIPATGDLLSDAEGYVHGILLFLDSFFGEAMEDSR